MSREHGNFARTPPCKRALLSTSNHSYFMGKGTKGVSKLCLSDEKRSAGLLLSSSTKTLKSFYPPCSPKHNFLRSELCATSKSCLVQVGLIYRLVVNKMPVGCAVGFAIVVVDVVLCLSVTLLLLTIYSGRLDVAGGGFYLASKLFVCPHGMLLPACSRYPRPRLKNKYLVRSNNNNSDDSTTRLPPPRPPPSPQQTLMRLVAIVLFHPAILHGVLNLMIHDAHTMKSNNPFHSAPSFNVRHDFEDRYFLDALCYLEESECVSNVGVCGFPAAPLALAGANGFTVASNLVRLFFLSLSFCFFVDVVSSVTFLFCFSWCVWSH